jgi:hypothetical protein
VWASIRRGCFGLWTGLACAGCAVAAPGVPGPRAVRTPPVEPARRPLRAVLIDCERVAPTEVRQDLPDGRTVDTGWVDPTGARLRLYVLLENLGAQDFLVSVCNGALRIVEAGATMPPCWPLDGAWTVVPRGISLTVYATLPEPGGSGVFSQQLLPQLGHAPEESWRMYVPDAVSFELTLTGCRPLGAPPTKSL